MDEKNNVPMLAPVWQIVVSPELARILLAIAVVQAIVAPFLGIRWAAYSIATALCSVAVSSQLGSIALSWVWHHVAALRGQIGKLHDEESRQYQPPRVIQ
jgi:hypothetical protein